MVVDWQTFKTLCTILSNMNQLDHTELCIRAQRDCNCICTCGFSDAIKALERMRISYENAIGVK